MKTIAATLLLLTGFSPDRATWQREYERRLLLLPQPSECGELLRELTRQPHLAGTEGGARVAAFIADEFRKAGLAVETPSYEVLLSYPKSARLTIVGEPEVRLGRLEEPSPPGRSRPSLHRGRGSLAPPRFTHHDAWVYGAFREPANLPVRVLFLVDQHVRGRLVVLYDGRRARISGPGSPLGATGVSMHVLTAGSRFRPETGEVRLALPAARSSAAGQ